MPRPVFLAACALALCWTAAVWTQSPGSATASPRRPGRPTGDPSRSARTACAACHREKYDAWRDGRHSRMVQAARAATALGDFTRTRLTLGGQPYRLRVAGDELYITESVLTGKPVERRVDYTLGNRRIQHYLTTIDRGRIVVLRPTWDVQRREWFDSVEIIRPDEQDTNPVQQWNKDCVGCHVSQQDNHYAAATRDLRHGMGGFRDLVRALPRSRERSRHPRRRTRHASAGTRGRHRPSDATRRRQEQHGLRPVPLAARCGGAGLPGRRGLLRLLRAEARVHAAQGAGSRRTGPTAARDASRTTPSGSGRAAVSCKAARPARPATTRTGPMSIATPSSRLATTRCARGATKRSARRSASTRGTRRPAPAAPASSATCRARSSASRRRIRDHSMSLPTPENTVAFGIPNACTECHSTRPASWAAEVHGEVVAQRPSRQGHRPRRPPSRPRARQKPRPCRGCWRSRVTPTRAR